ncbi:hypothetical protein [Mycoplana ramosa]|uniref:Uncharacterized protein n=1 Tax=Mycoplana ramosa TaxID=40837 RepID=A0ABW3YYG9_MYCRA
MVFTRFCSGVAAPLAPHRSAEKRTGFGRQRKLEELKRGWNATHSEFKCGVTRACRQINPRAGRLAGSQLFLGLFVARAILARAETCCRQFP